MERLFGTAESGEEIMKTTFTDLLKKYPAMAWLEGGELALYAFQMGVYEAESKAALEKFHKLGMLDALTNDLERINHG